jgi:methionine aminopeptidase
LYIGEIYDGYALERAVLGVSSTEICSEVKDFFKSDDKRRYKYSNFVKAVKIVKDIQDKIGHWNPKEPATKIARSLLESVASNLKNRGGNLRFYSSVGTLLDYKYGADCFFILTDKDCEAIVTIDLTISRTKRKSKADIVLTADDLRDDSRYHKIMEMVAERLIRKIIKSHRRYKYCGSRKRRNYR